MYKVSSFEFRISIFIFFLLGATACNRFHTQPPTEADRRELAAQFKNAVKDSGGAQVWIKHPARSRHEQGSGQSLQVLATSGVYRAVLARVQREADQRHLDLGSAPYPSAGGLPAVTLSVMQPSGQRVLQIHVREVPRLLRAAIVIDDVGNDLEATRKLLALDYPLTFSVLPYVRYSRISAEEAHRSGHEVMLHLPMEPEPGAHASPGEGAILVGMNAAEVRKAVESDLEAVPFVAGVNNHMGSRATREAALMDEVMKTLAGHRLYFIDSRTTATSLALDTARRQHLPAFYRTVFLDDTETVA